MKDWAEFLKIISKRFGFWSFAVWVSGGLLLVLPEIIPQDFSTVSGLSDFRQTYGRLIGPITVIAFVMWLATAITWITTKYKNNWARQKIREQVLQSISFLSQRELFLLAYCVFRNQQTIHVPLNNGEALSLCNKGLLKRAGGTGQLLYWPFTVTQFVWDYLQRNPHLVLPADASNDRQFLANIENFEDMARSNRYPF